MAQGLENEHAVKRTTVSMLVKWLEINKMGFSMTKSKTASLRVENAAILEG